MLDQLTRHPEKAPPPSCREIGAQGPFFRFSTIADIRSTAANIRNHLAEYANNTFEEVVAWLHLQPKVKQFGFEMLDKYQDRASRFPRVRSSLILDLLNEIDDQFICPELPPFLRKKIDWIILQEDLLHQMATDPALHKEYITQRQERLPHAIAALSGRKDVHLVLAPRVSVGGGTLGFCKLIERSVREKVPNIKITTEIASESSAIRMFDYNPTPHNAHSVADLIVYFDSPLKMKRGGSAISLVNLPQARNDSEAIVDNHHLVHFLIEAPSGSLPFDSSLFERRNRSDTWSIETLLKQREIWLEENLTEDGRQALNSLGRNHNNLGWGFCYSRDERIFEAGFSRFINSLPTVTNAFNENTPLLYFVAFPKDRYTIDKLTDPTTFFPDLGFTVIGTQGEIFHSKMVDSQNIVVLLDGTSNAAVRTLLSENCGFPGAFNADGRRIQLPCFVTGNASWLEAVSSGLPTVHDGWDVERRGFIPTAYGVAYRSVLLQNGLEGAPSTSSFLETTCAEFLVPPSTFSEWTMLGQRTTSEIAMANTADDIIIALAQSVTAKA